VNILLVYAKPDTGKYSLCNSIKDRLNTLALAAGNKVVIQDLYKDNFAPVLAEDELNRKFPIDNLVLRYQKEIASSGYIIFIYPDWWGFCPAILKGWFDRVLSPGFAYDYTGPDFGAKNLIPLLSGLKSLVICTADNDSSMSLHDNFWKTILPAQTGIENRYLNCMTQLKRKSDNDISAELASIEHDIQKILDDIR
jgi:NAD(P)H dehydrogenase (quinone)